MPYLVFAYTDDALGSMYKGSLFVCCRGVVVASPAGWYPIPALTAWGCPSASNAARVWARTAASSAEKCAALQQLEGLDISRRSDAYLPATENGQATVPTGYAENMLSITSWYDRFRRSTNPAA